MKTETWIPAKPQAEFSKRKWDKDIDENKFWKNYFKDVCPQSVKKYLSYGKNTFSRTGIMAPRPLLSVCLFY